MKLNLSNIQNVVFDLGNVIVNLDFDATIRAFARLGLRHDVLNRQQVYTDRIFYEFEVGAISKTDFFEGVRRLLNNSQATNQEIAKAWSAMIRDVPPERVKTLQKLARNYKLFLFSNTNQIHIEEFHAAFKAQHGIDFPSFFVKDYYSHEIHERKPDISSYQKVIELAGINPEESLFVDDLEKNIVGAGKAGLQTFWLKPGMELSRLF